MDDIMDCIASSGYPNDMSAKLDIIIKQQKDAFKQREHFQHQLLQMMQMQMQMQMSSPTQQQQQQPQQQREQQHPEQKQREEQEDQCDDAGIITKCLIRFTAIVI